MYANESHAPGVRLPSASKCSSRARQGSIRSDVAWQPHGATDQGHACTRARAQRRDTVPPRSLTSKTRAADFAGTDFSATPPGARMPAEEPWRTHRRACITRKAGVSIVCATCFWWQVLIGYCGPHKSVQPSGAPLCRRHGCAPASNAQHVGGGWQLLIVCCGAGRCAGATGAREFRQAGRHRPLAPHLRCLCSSGRRSGRCSGARICARARAAHSAELRPAPPAAVHGRSSQVAALRPRLRTLAALPFRVRPRALARLARTRRRGAGMVELEPCIARRTSGRWHRSDPRASPHGTVCKGTGASLSVPTASWAVCRQSPSAPRAAWCA